MKVLKLFLKVIVFCGLKIWEIILNPIKRSIIYLGNYIKNNKIKCLCIILIIILSYIVGYFCSINAWLLIKKPIIIELTLGNFLEILFIGIWTLLLGFLSIVWVILIGSAFYGIASVIKTLKLFSKFKLFIKDNWDKSNNVVNKLFDKKGK